ncbi:3-hydroxyacyl-CoA dehydrogenase [Falsiroseomonas tokyonensis]|uniref:3-hydroxyacyl-CoA dehydrogenase n=1 Tax=Falsiroseomonas tokyonensis TaxID=430521 RepID=A0ABV7C0P6_9PROT|nr:3-hydroxyacyl-CoA dehydrogenase [Falsiroseomonas tokyonensis]MBU8539875.1 3-hydroxyacyl-CoA dehydrogenase [Falsiroseomonas tokyonensis]
MAEARKVAIVGAGLIGRAWAMIFARAGWQAALHDPSPAALQAAPGLCAQGLAELARHGLCADPAAAAARISLAPSLAAALAGAEFVQENGPEDAATKRAIFAELDALAAPGCLLASSTSAIPASVFTEGLAGRARCLVAHPVNPPHLVPVVELCGAPWTAPETLARAREIFAGIGQAPVTVKREVEGFILNRLQGALLAEAFRLVQEGYVSPQDLDTTVAEGLGLRWSFLGPFATIELNAPGGIPDYCARYGPFYGRIAAAPPSPEVFGAAGIGAIMAQWGETPDRAEIAKRSARRDARLAALAAHKKEAEKA